MRFLFTLIRKKYNDTINNNVVLCTYINKGTQSIYSNEIMQRKDLILHKVFELKYKIRAFLTP